MRRSIATTRYNKKSLVNSFAMNSGASLTSLFSKIESNSFRDSGVAKRAENMEFESKPSFVTSYRPTCYPIFAEGSSFPRRPEGIL